MVRDYLIKADEPSQQSQQPNSDSMAGQLNMRIALGLFLCGAWNPIVSATGMCRLYIELLSMVINTSCQTLDRQPFCAFLQKKGMSDIPLSIFNRQHCTQYHKLIVRLRQHSKNKTRHLHTHSETTMLLMLQNGYRERCVRFGLSKEWHAKAAFLWQVNRRAISFSHGCKN